MKATVLNFEEKMKLSIPAARYALSIILKRDYSFNQTAIASSLGITQAAVNKYLNGRCSKEILTVGTTILKMPYAKTVAGKIARAKGAKARNGLIDRLASDRRVVMSIR